MRVEDMTWRATSARPYSAVGTLQGLGVGFNAGVCAACTKATFKAGAYTRPLFGST
jgi:hypothetical protein